MIAQSLLHSTSERFLCLMLQGKKRKASSQGQARMYVAKDESAAAAFNQGRSMQGLQEVPLGQRATSTSGRDSVVTARYSFYTSKSSFFLPGQDSKQFTTVIPYACLMSCILLLRRLRPVAWYHFLAARLLWFCHSLFGRFLYLRMWGCNSGCSTAMVSIWWLQPSYLFDKQIMMVNVFVCLLTLSRSW